MLREDLKDSDIPHRTHLRNRVMELLQEYLSDLEKELRVCLSVPVIYFI
jgi:hypothetical protein